MEELAKKLQETIDNLEKLRDSQPSVDSDVIKKLDQLYQTQLELISAAINADTAKYAEVIEALQKAATETEQAVNDLTNVENAIGKVANAIGKVGDLLGKIV